MELDLDGHALAGEDVVEVQHRERSSVGSSVERDDLWPDGAGMDRAHGSGTDESRGDPSESIRQSPSPESQGATWSITKGFAPSHLIDSPEPVRYRRRVPR